jgi:membrane protein
MAKSSILESVGESLGRRARSLVPPPHIGRTLGRFGKHLLHELANDNITDIGAMMAYYAILSLFPMLVFVVTLGLLVVPEETILQGLAMATQAMPPSTGDVVATQVISALRGANAGFAVGSAALALWGASRGVGSLMGPLNVMFSKAETRPYWKRQLVAVGVTLGVALLVIVALGLLVVGPVAGHWLADRFGLGDAFDTGWDVVRWVGAGLLVTFVWAVLYKFLPNTDAPFRVFTPGAITGVLLWLGISYGFGVYLRHFDSYGTTYGALGGGIVFLTWLWLSNMALLFGAEINHVIAGLRNDTGEHDAVG